MSSYWICPMENVWFCFIFIVWVNFSHKTEKICFESQWHALIFFDKRNDVRFDYALSNSVWTGWNFVGWVEF